MVNITCSFFSSFVAAASLSRSLVQDNVGGKTQVTFFFLLINREEFMLAALMLSCTQALMTCLYWRHWIWCQMFYFSDCYSPKHLFLWERERICLCMRLCKMCVIQVWTCIEFCYPLRLGRWPEFSKNIVIVIFIYFFGLCSGGWPCFQCSPLGCLASVGYLLQNTSKRKYHLNKVCRVL